MFVQKGKEITRLLNQSGIASLPEKLFILLLYCCYSYSCYIYSCYSCCCYSFCIYTRNSYICTVLLFPSSPSNGLHLDHLMQIQLFQLETLHFTSTCILSRQDKDCHKGFRDSGSHYSFLHQWRRVVFVTVTPSRKIIAEITSWSPCLQLLYSLFSKSSQFTRDNIFFQTSIHEIWKPRFLLVQTPPPLSTDKHCATGMQSAAPLMSETELNQHLPRLCWLCTAKSTTEAVKLWFNLWAKRELSAHLWSEDFPLLHLAANRCSTVCFLFAFSLLFFF